MRTSTVNISFDEDFLKQIDRVAEEESRSRSELIREAARSYIERKRKWQTIFASAAKAASFSGLRPEDIKKEIASYRKQRHTAK
jgi:metal-responsive CopG/Arc/MetJ family transcriptional regulator